MEAVIYLSVFPPKPSLKASHTSLECQSFFPIYCSRTETAGLSYCLDGGWGRESQSQSQSQSHPNCLPSPFNLGVGQSETLPSLARSLVHPAASAPTGEHPLMQLNQTWKTWNCIEGVESTVAMTIAFLYTATLCKRALNIRLCVERSLMGRHTDCHMLGPEASLVEGDWVISLFHFLSLPHSLTHIAEPRPATAQLASHIGPAPDHCN